MIAVLVSTIRLSAAPDPLGPVDQDPDQIRETACKLVAPDQVCVPPRPRPSSSATDLSWLGAILWVLLAIAVGVLIWLLVRAVMQSRRNPRPRRAKAGKGDDEPIDDLGTVVAVDWSHDPQQWRAEADEHRRAGRWRDALRCRYRALVGDLARRGLIDEIPGRTTGEERRQLTVAAADAQAPFGAAADLFDGAWYGSTEVGEREDDALLRLEAQVLEITMRERQ
jgi:hypothetical protein